MQSTAEEIAVGAEAPDFTLMDQDQQEVRLSEYRGKKNVVLAFYPLDWSPVCTNENTCLTQDLTRFHQTDTEVFGISVDSTWSHKAWADALGIRHRLLSDMGGEVASRYGLYLPENHISKRATVIVDRDGKVRYRKVQEILSARDNEEILSAVRQLS